MSTEEPRLKLPEQQRLDGFNAALAKNAQDAKDKILATIPVKASVGVANTFTVRRVARND